MSSDAAAGAATGAQPIPAEVQKALGWLLRSTQQRPQTEAELRAKLKSRGEDDDVVDQVMARAKALRAVDDAAFARAWVEDRGAVRGYGTTRLRDELRRRLVPEPLIDDALALLDARDDLAVATDLARARVQRLPARLPPESALRRVHGYLVRRGYAPALAWRAARTATGMDRDWD